MYAPGTCGLYLLLLDGILGLQHQQKQTCMFLVYTVVVQRNYAASCGAFHRIAVGQPSSSKLFSTCTRTKTAILCNLTRNTPKQWLIWFASVQMGSAINDKLSTSDWCAKPICASWHQATTPMSAEAAAAASAAATEAAASAATGAANLSAQHSKHG
jgi:hypothetical protein